MRERVGVVVVTHDRRDECTATVRQLLELGEADELIVVDNASRDGTAAALRRSHPGVRVIESPRNLGAAGRNLGVRAATAPYVALCDDDCCWAPGALTRAATILREHPWLALVCARVLVGDERRVDPAAAAMAASPVPSAHPLPGPALVGFLAGASMVRADAFLAVGGFEPRFFLGGEEELVGLDLAQRGWSLAYVPELVVHHRPSPSRDAAARRRALVRNRLWVTWLRLPARAALVRTARITRTAWSTADGRRAVASALAGSGWVWRERASVSRELAAVVLALDEAANGAQTATHARQRRERRRGSVQELQGSPVGRQTSVA